MWTAEGWLYVAVVIDLFSRRVVGWSMSAEMTAQLVTDALVMAIWRRGKPDALLHHSDRGSQYTSEQFQKLMADHGIVCSMSRSGNVWDNAAMESFFSSLKTERTARKTYRTRDEAKADVFDYIERFYNAKGMPYVCFRFIYAFFANAESAARFASGTYAELVGRYVRRLPSIPLRAFAVRSPSLMPRPERWLWRN